MKYTKEELIELIEKAFVDTNLWGDRDSYYSQCRLGKCYALLKDNCKFKVLTNGDLKTDEDTIWIEIKAKGFGYFDYGGELEREIFYIPTQKRLDEANGGDWY